MLSRTQERHSVIVIDDHPIVREGLAMQIGLQDDLFLAGEASSVATAMVLINESMPDLIITDLSLGDGHGLDLLRTVRDIEPSARVLIYSMHDENTYAEAARQAGAVGYLSKSASSEQTMAAIRAALSAPVSATFVKRAAKHASSSSLTARERQIFQLIGEGLSTRAIADHLKLSIHTVDTHREHIKTKLKLDSAAQLVRSALQNNLKERGID